MTHDKRVEALAHALAAATGCNPLAQVFVGTPFVVPTPVGMVSLVPEQSRPLWTLFFEQAAVASHHMDSQK